MNGEQAKADAQRYLETQKFPGPCWVGDTYDSAMSERIDRMMPFVMAGFVAGYKRCMDRFAV